MAKKAKEKEEVELVIEENAVEPCWCRYPDKAASYCTVYIDLGGSGWAAHAEFTEKEEHDTKDVSALKRERLREAMDAIHAKALEYLNG